MADGFFESTQVRETDVTHMLQDFKEATPTFGGVTGEPIQVVFEVAFQLVLDGVESVAPAATCKTTDVSAAVHGDTLAIDGVTYNIIGIHPDGTGVTVLVLSRD